MESSDSAPDGTHEVLRDHRAELEGQSTPVIAVQAGESNAKIAAEPLSRIESFERLHTNSEYDDTGIEHGPCESIVECQDSTIWVGSEPGDGSIVSRTLPVEDG